MLLLGFVCQWIHLWLCQSHYIEICPKMATKLATNCNFPLIFMDIFLLLFDNLCQVIPLYQGFWGQGIHLWWLQNKFNMAPKMATKCHIPYICKAFYWTVIMTQYKGYSTMRYSYMMYTSVPQDFKSQQQILNRGGASNIPPLNKDF